MTNGNPEVHSCGRDATKNDGCDLRAAERTKGEVEAQAKTKYDFGAEEASFASCDDLSDNATGADDDAERDGLLAADLVRDIAAEKASKKLSDCPDDVECGLPAGRKNSLSLVDVSRTSISCACFQDIPGEGQYPKSRRKDGTEIIAPLT